MPESRRRRKATDAVARRTQAQQARAAEAKKITMAQYRLRRAVGWTLVAVGVFIGVSHWIGHLGYFHVASPGVEDLLIGYPTAALIAIAGSIVLTKA